MAAMLCEGERERGWDRKRTREEVKEDEMVVGGFVEGRKMRDPLMGRIGSAGRDEVDLTFFCCQNSTNFFLFFFFSCLFFFLLIYSHSALLPSNHVLITHHPSHTTRSPPPLSNHTDL